MECIDRLTDNTSDLSPITVRVDGVNASRGADQAVLYTALYGVSTDTNEYGYEITTEDGIITQLGGNNSPIPKNGFVLSLHGTTMTAMRTRIAKGMSVQYDAVSNTVVFSYDTKGLQRSVAYAVESAQKKIDQAKAAFVYADYHHVQSGLVSIRQESLDLFQNEVTFEVNTESVHRCLALIEKVDTLCRTLCDSYPVRYRGVWIRPSQNDAAEVEEYIKTLHDAHINFVCVEGWFANGFIMELPKGSLFSKHADFRYDVLQAYVDACHKYGMECHLWMPILNVGSFFDKGHENTLAGRKPEWMSLSNHGSPRNANGFMMIDPANREACNYLLEFYRYIVTTYAIDGFEMDYIRYYAASAEEDYGYTKAAFEGFEEAYGYGVTPEYNTQAVYWNDWCQYRRDCITELVRNIRAMVDNAAPNVLLAADVAFPFEHALNSVYQNFPQWLDEGLLDILHPMAYGDGYGEAIAKSVALAGKRCMVVTGLGAQGDLLRVDELERQTRENADYGAYGENFFEANAYFYKQIPPAVADCAYRRSAISPFLNVVEAVCSALDYITERVDNIIRPFGGMSEGEAAAVKKAVESEKECVRNDRLPLAGFITLRKAISAVDNTRAVRVLEKDCYRAEHILYVKNRVTFDEVFEKTPR